MNFGEFFTLFYAFGTKIIETLKHQYMQFLSKLERFSLPSKEIKGKKHILNDKKIGQKKLYFLFLFQMQIRKQTQNMFIYSTFLC